LQNLLVDNVDQKAVVEDVSSKAFVKENLTCPTTLEVSDILNVSNWSQHMEEQGYSDA
jgi:hypothetical protein